MKCLWLVVLLIVQAAQATLNERQKVRKYFDELLAQDDSNEWGEDDWIPLTLAPRREHTRRKRRYSTGKERKVGWGLRSLTSAASAASNVARSAGIAPPTQLKAMGAVAGGLSKSPLGGLAKKMLYNKMKSELNEQIQSVADDIQEQLSPIPITLEGTILALVTKAATTTQMCVSAATEKLKTVGADGLVEGIKAQNEHIAKLNAKLKAQWKAEREAKKAKKKAAKAAKKAKKKGESKAEEKEESADKKEEEPADKKEEESADKKEAKADDKTELTVGYDDEDEENEDDEEDGDEDEEGGKPLTEAQKKAKAKKKLERYQKKLAKVPTIDQTTGMVNEQLGQPVGATATTIQSLRGQLSLKIKSSLEPYKANVQKAFANVKGVRVGVYEKGFNTFKATAESFISKIKKASGAKGEMMQMAEKLKAESYASFQRRVGGALIRTEEKIRDLGTIKGPKKILNAVKTTLKANLPGLRKQYGGAPGKKRPPKLKKKSSGGDEDEEEGDDEEEDEEDEDKEEDDEDDDDEGDDDDDD